jgi:hypothetical protein
VIPNAEKDARFADNPFVTGDFHLCFYAGVPIHGPGGEPVGALGYRRGAHMAALTTAVFTDGRVETTWRARIDQVPVFA